MVRIVSVLTLGVLALGLVPAAASCPEDALGTARELRIDALSMPQVGRKHFPGTLPLAPKEVVLTFDDGPWPGTTDRVLDALKRECVRASFFLVGRNVAAHPALARRALAEGHTIGNHTYSHPLLNQMPLEKAEAEIARGFAAIDTALYGQPLAAPATPFFRFPGFASSPALLDRLQQKGVVVFGADLWASDWNPMTAVQTLGLVLGRLDAAGGGIVLFHDTQPHTAGMIPEFLRELKRRGYRVVHVVPTKRFAEPTVR